MPFIQNGTGGFDLGSPAYPDTIAPNALQLPAELRAAAVANGCARASS